MKTQKDTGFTIVELLIVIVVIGILTVLAIGAFSRAQDQAKVASVQSDLKASAKQLEQKKAETGTYPATSAGLPASPNTTYQYRYDSTTDTFCLSGFNGSQALRITSSERAPVTGPCFGHNVGGPTTITNLSQNPSFETGSGFNGYNSGGGYVTGGAYAGSRHMRAFGHNTAPVGGPFWDGAGVQGNRTYRMSVQVRSNVTAPRTLSIEWLNGSFGIISSNSLVTQPMTADWSVMTGTATSPAGAVIARATLYTTSAGSSSDYVDIDGVIVTEGTNTYNFADGSTAGWTWNGTANSSTSTGMSQQ